MRSRYSAYAVDEVDYLFDTHDPSTRDELDMKAARKWARNADWLALEILATSEGGENDDHGIVEFIARYEEAGKVRGHHERSEFRRVDGRWFFHDGEQIKAQPIVHTEKKVGRNDPCPCGSGKKHKKCCGRRASAGPTSA